MTNVERKGTTFARRVAITVAAWAAAYAVVNVVVMAGGSRLATAPRGVQTLVVSGTLVIVMVNLLMPAIGGLVGRLFTARR
jgi:hypothetical protein